MISAAELAAAAALMLARVVIGSGEEGGSQL